MKNFMPLGSGQKFSRLRTIFVASLLTTFNSSQILLTTVSKVGGVYEYDYATVPFLAELIKMLVCSFLLWRESLSNNPPKITLAWRSLRLYPIPSVLYLLLNNVHFAALALLDPSTFQILSNLKIVTTGILFRLFLQRELTPRKWFALFLLTTGTTLTQLRSPFSASSSGTPSFLIGPLDGYGLAILGTLLSALAGVYTEYLMKKDDDSIYWQNLQLYVCV